MSDHTHILPDDCSRFDEWLLRASPEDEASAWAEHLDTCPSCREQWTTHRFLVSAFAGEPVPRLSPSFQAGLDRKLAAEVRVERLSGWRLAAMVGYAAAALALMAWILEEFPLPRLGIDYSSPWAISAGLALVPVSLFLAAAVSRLLPPPQPKGKQLLTL